jgi:hypothetical protein
LAITPHPMMSNHWQATCLQSKIYTPGLRPGVQF